MKTVKCPSCNAKIRIDKYTERGDILYCDECEEEFVIVSLRPVKLQPVTEDDYDDDYYDD